MKVIWKRPDGFHEAVPSDYRVFEVSETCKIWLHKDDHENYPFRVSGGWQDEKATHKLNRLVNLMPQENSPWLEYLKECLDDSPAETPAAFIKKELMWIDTLLANLKGDTWEVEIMTEALERLKSKMQEHAPALAKLSEKTTHS